MNLKAARLKKNLSQADLSKKIKISEVQISRYEQGHSLPRPATRRAIEDVLGPIDWPDTGQPLSSDEQSNLFRALKVAASRLGGYEDALSLFSNKGPDELRKLIRIALQSEENLLLPPEVQKKERR